MLLLIPVFIPVGYVDEAWSFLRGEKESPFLALDSRLFQNRSYPTVKPLYFPGQLGMLDRLFTAQGWLIEEYGGG